MIRIAFLRLNCWSVSDECKKSIVIIIKTALLMLSTWKSDDVNIN